ncbi:uncharacterized protein NECHADRAFT_88689 [Fusarium vanettenii 77-13-4]|uniref:Uncharacterized protein n=1 Tax=Fusarium vanettenii (strain ATCC MYA-4622 / CBS 123669 / FGSC 9596 / NRRL 45880 / 77-13-4) TaxID=660122 RepID=C7ZLI7_FUSV7|nr:uncharacterized protein NECHADRAFT_88689 [Fusarium vanettenii 77-13-4]EEU35123.1 predicted protein [Fusarium vanettenii 77-13-4]
MPYNDSETFRGYPIESLANNTSTKINWPVDDRVLFLQHAARYQITKPNMVDCGADELYTKLGISARPEYYKRVVGRRVTSALVYLVTEKLRKSGLLVKTRGRDQITGAQIEIWRWPTFTRNWLAPGWTGNQGAPDDWDGELREDVPGRRASTPSPVGRGRGRHSNRHDGHGRARSQESGGMDGDERVRASVDNLAQASRGRPRARSMAASHDDQLSTFWDPIRIDSQSPPRARNRDGSPSGLQPPFMSAAISTPQVSQKDRAHPMNHRNLRIVTGSHRCLESRRIIEGIMSPPSTPPSRYDDPRTWPEPPRDDPTSEPEPAFPSPPDHDLTPTPTQSSFPVIDPTVNRRSWSRQPPRQSQGSNDDPDTNEHALCPALSACGPDPALSEEALSIATQSLQYAQSELKHWFLAGVAGTQGDSRGEYQHICAARYAATMRIQYANQAVAVLKEARKNEPRGLLMDSSIWNTVLKVGPEWERFYIEEAEEDR